MCLFRVNRWTIFLSCSNFFQMCAVQQIVSDSGHLFYDVGCSSAEKCSHKRSAFSNADNVAGDVIICSECCSGNFCNMQGCGTKYLNAQRGPICFACVIQATFDSCELITSCGKDQVCFVSKFVNQLNSLQRYSSGCTYQQQCTVEATNHSNSGMQCCSDDFCNNEYEETPTSTPLHTVTPTTAATVAPTAALKSTTTFRAPTTTTTHSVYVRPTLTVQEKVRLCSLLGYMFYEDIDMCIRVDEDEKTWSQARQVCMQDGGDLAMFIHVTPPQLERWSNGHLKPGQYALQYLVGATDMNHEGNWTWLDGTQVDHLLFLSGEPNHQNEENCASIFQRNGHTLLNDDVCETAMPFICSINLQAMADVFVKPVNRLCRNDGYTPIPSMGLCYKIYNQERRSQGDARAMCLHGGADLLQIQSREEEKYFQGLNYEHKDGDLYRYWLGAQRSGDQFYWFNGHVVGGDLQWDDGEPNNYKGLENCLNFRYASEIRNIGLNDDNCNTGYFFICEEKCPNTSYRYFQRSSLQLCFHAVYENLTWTEARAYCQNEHSTLLEPETPQYVEFFQLYMHSAHHETQFWVGAEFRSAQQKYYWLTHGRPISNDMWQSGTTISNQTACVAMSRSYVDGSWGLRTQLCTARNAFICQYLW
ncbi:hypothetical protein DPMN_030701 [Dreissena polymorpha]|uniref:C-type lectin domain-containing protein n=1 Tax=Dreissena polymorpha TaxID=45954 RepID=A0A9D4RGM0_DREPO|nr:hypothetical protein DPMN_030701 [Dreissena polymorpha]